MGRTATKSKRQPRTSERASEASSSAASSLLYPAMLAVACLLAYSNSFKGPFLFDDMGAIVGAENIRHLGDWRSWLLNNPRPVITFSLAVNYAISGLNPFSYHVVNVLGHIFSAWLLFAIVRRTLRMPNFGDSVRTIASGLAFVIALLWALHPLQTQALTFVIQRAEALMSLFGLLMFYAVIRGASSQRSILWYTLSVIAFMLSAGCKVGLPTMPLVIFFYDYLFLTQSFGTSLRKRGILYLAQVLSFVFVLQFTSLGASLFSSDPGYAVSMGFALREHTWKQYAASQPEIVLYYLSLALWPARLCLDYEWKPVTDAAHVILPLIPILALAAVTLWGLYRKHWAAFLGIWFFGLIGPSSSFMPVRDLAFEHRMYLPLAGLIAALVAVGFAVMTRMSAAHRTQAGAILVSVLALAYGIRTFVRNYDYSSAVTIWRATVEARPDNTRAWTNYGEALASINRSDWAAEAFRKAISLNANAPDAYYNLGNSLQLMKQYPESEKAYLKAIELAPTNIEPRVNLGSLYKAMGDLSRSEQAFRQAFAHQTRESSKFTIAKAHYNFGNVLIEQNRLPEAMVEYRLAVETAPNYDKAHLGLGFGFEKLGQFEDAYREYARAIELDPRSEAREFIQPVAKKLNKPLPPGVLSSQH